MQSETGADVTTVIRQVRWRYRICNYLFRVGALWIFAGYSAEIFLRDPIWKMVLLVGLGIFSAAMALTFAIYRCPVCNKYLSRFRPDNEYAPDAGYMLRESASRA